MGDLSKDFNAKEFTCKCGCGFNNISPRLVAICQVIRDEMGKAVRINSACRCRTHNQKVGGVPNSYHTQGFAADLSFAGDARTLFNTIKRLYGNGKLNGLEYCKLYIKKNFCHIDIGRKRNNRFAEG